jgi:hypothetical protein
MEAKIALALLLRLIFFQKSLAQGLAIKKLKNFVTTQQMLPQ